MFKSLLVAVLMVPLLLVASPSQAQELSATAVISCKYSPKTHQLVKTVKVTVSTAAETAEVKIVSFTGITSRTYLYTAPAGVVSIYNLPFADTTLVYLNGSEAARVDSSAPCS